MQRLISATLALSLFASNAPLAIAEDTSTISIDAPTELPCEGTSGKNRARCITDALKAWKELEHDYDEAEDERVKAWKDEHAGMGVGSDYQKLLREFLNQVHKDRKEFRKQLQAFRKEFFDEQKAKLNEGSRKTTEKDKNLEKSKLEAAKKVCGVPDDDGLYRTCIRQQLRGIPSSVTKRSRSSNALIGK